MLDPLALPRGVLVRTPTEKGFVDGLGEHRGEATWLSVALFEQA